MFVVVVVIYTDCSNKCCDCNIRTIRCEISIFSLHCIEIILTENQLEAISLTGRVDFNAGGSFHPGGGVGFR